MLYKSLALLLGLLSQSDAFMLAPPQGAVAACRSPAAAIDSTPDEALRANPELSSCKSQACLPAIVAQGCSPQPCISTRPLTPAVLFYPVRSGSPRAEEGNKETQFVPAEEEQAI